MPSKIFLMPAVALAALLPSCYMSTGDVFSDDVSTDSSHDPAAEDLAREEIPPFDAPDEIYDPAEAIDIPDVPVEPEAFDDDPAVGEDAIEVPGDPDVPDPDSPPEDSGEDPLDVVELPPGIVWVSIPAGPFDMGCSPGDGSCYSSENPSHPVTVAAFRMTETEITQAQYEWVTGETPSHFSGCPDCPVEQVDWYQAKAFCEAIGGRLPSEAEWEYAARAETTTPWTCGDASSSCLGDIAWYDANAGGTTNPVKGKAANAFDLHDMLGNVLEWVEDCWHDDYTGAPSTGEVWSGGNCDYRVLRGGSCFNGDVGLRVSARYRLYPDDWDSYFGLRCAQ